MYFDSNSDNLWGGEINHVQHFNIVNQPLELFQAAMRVGFFELLRQLTRALRLQTIDEASARLHRRGVRIALDRALGVTKLGVSGPMRGPNGEFRHRFIPLLRPQLEPLLNLLG